MEALVRRVQESSNLSVLDADDVVYVARVPVPTRKIMTVAIDVGTRLPAYPTSMGRVLLAALPEPELECYLARVRLEPLTRWTVTDPARLRATLVRVRAEGYALVDQELEEGLRSLSVPVHDGTGAVVAALNLATSSGRYAGRQVLDELLPLLRGAAARVEEDLAAG